MGKFKEIDLDIQDTINFTIKLQIIILAIVSTIGVFILSAENTQLKERNTLIEKDRTELMQDVKHLQDENKALRSVVETYNMPNNLDTRE